MSLKNKKVLITAGPTWVPIDSVRVISNVATGQTGILLARELQRLKAKVTLLLGPAEKDPKTLLSKIRVLRFSFFDQLQAEIKKELKKRHYDIVIHSAAVSDYMPQRTLKYKLSSGFKNWSLKLEETPKIIDSIKEKLPDLLLVGFKFEAGKQKSSLLESARRLLARAKLDLVVANTISKNRYRAYIIGKTGEISGPMRSKEHLCKRLISIISCVIADSAA